MRKRSLNWLLATASMMVLATTGASAATYNIGWAGSAGYSMTGVLMFSDSLLNTGVIDESQIGELAIEVFLSGVSQGSRSLLTDGFGSTAATFNVNFDTVTGQFLVGGTSTSATGQSWFSNAGEGCDTVGFASGSSSQGVCVGGFFLGTIPIATAIGESRLTATFAGDLTPIPLPAALPLFAAGLAGLGFVGWRKHRRGGRGNCRPGSMSDPSTGSG